MIGSYAGWDWIDCGCCNGVTWGSGEECDTCGGSGRIAKHVRTGALAAYPGGHFVGRESAEPPMEGKP